MPILIHGMHADKYFKKQRIDEARIEPIKRPFEVSVAKEFIGISEDNAWLPMSIALVNRLHRLVTVVCGGSFVPERIDGDEYLYQVMRTSLFNVLGSYPFIVETRDLIDEGIPDQLPTSAALSRYGLQDISAYNNSFEAIQQSLVKDAVKLGILPDPRTVEDALASFDARLGVIALTHYQNALRRADGLELDEQDRDELRQSIRSEQRHLRNGIPQYLAMAIEILERIDAIWTFLYPDTRSLDRYHNDEFVYQTYLSLLLRSLSSHEYRELSQLAQDLLPRLLPQRHEQVASNPLFAEMPVRLERLHYEIVARATQLGEPVVIDYANEPDLDSLFEEELWHWEQVIKGVNETREKKARQLNGTIVQLGGARRGRGRPASNVTYEMAAEVWWKLHKAFENKPPTQKEISEHLQLLGYTVGDRTLRNKITEWTANNLKWPPPKDWSKAA